MRNLGSPDVEDPDWWVKGLVQREQLDMTGAMPPAIALRKEAATFPESLLDLRTEESVRIVLEDFTHRVKVDRLRPAVGNLPPLLARTVDVDELVEQWRELRAQRAAAARAQALPVTAPAASGAGRRDRGSWIRRLLGRS